MCCDKISPLIDIKNCNNTEDIIDYIYEYFKENIMGKEKRPKLFNKSIFIDFNNWINYKAEMFWHIVSLNDNEKFNILPCNNDISSIYKKDNCINHKYRIEMSNGSVRSICLYRAIRISWFIDIINLANSKDKSIKSWVKDKNLYLRFQHQSIDYAIVFQIQKNMYRLLSMFPVFYINKKQEFDNDYNKYQKIKKR